MSRIPLIMKQSHDVQTEIASILITNSSSGNLSCKNLQIRTIVQIYKKTASVRLQTVSNTVSFRDKNVSIQGPLYM